MCEDTDCPPHAQPDWGSNPQPFSSQDDAPPNGAARPGLPLGFLSPTSRDRYTAHARACTARALAGLGLS